jgi:hypothetical protein
VKNAKTTKKKVMVGLAATGAVIGTVATGGIGGAIIAGVSGGILGHGIGQKNENAVKDRIQKVQFNTAGSPSKLSPNLKK